jgi:phosphoglycerol transferase
MSEIALEPRPGRTTDHSDANDTPVKAARPPVYTGAAFIGLILAVVSLKLWRADLSVPLYYAFGGDGFWQAALAKNLMQGGTSAWFPRLAAPLGAAVHDFPTLSSLQITIERIFLLVTGKPNVALNLLFIFSFPATMVTGVFALRRLAVPTSVAFALTSAYTILPARFDRNEGHLFFATYWMLPLCVLLCVLIARGDLRTTVPGTRRPTGFAIFGAAVAVLVGADNEYHAAFVIAVLAMAAALGYLRSRRIEVVAFSALVAFLIAGTVFAELVPTFAYQIENGPNGAAFQRYPEESMTYGLHIAELVLPIHGHRFEKFAHKRAYYDERSGLASNESSWSSFGIIGTLGFFALLAVLLLRINVAVSPDIETLAVFNLWCVLIATVGGFGTLFNFYVRPEIRAYNRISTLLAFICIAGLALMIAALLRRRKRAYPMWLGALGVVGTMAFALWDQTSPLMGPPYAANTALFQNDAVFTAAMESSVAPGTAVLELPWVRFPESPPVVQLTAEDLFRPYIHANTLRFSYGAVDGRDPAPWQQLVESLPPSEIVKNGVLAGFGGIVVFRKGYDDGGAAIETTFRSMLGDPIVSPDGTLAFYSMQKLRQRVISVAPQVATASYQDQFVRIVDVRYGSGFSALESNPTQTWHWSAGDSVIVLHNSGSMRRRMHLRATIETPSGPSNVSILFPDRTLTVATSPLGSRLDVTFTVPPGIEHIQFHTDAAPIVAPGDPRVLVFRLVDPEVETEQNLPPHVSAVFANAAAIDAPVDAFGPASVRYVSGCYPQETNTMSRWHWCDAAATFLITSSRSGAYALQFRASTPGQPSSVLHIASPGGTLRIPVSPTGTQIREPLHLTAGSPTTVRLTSNAVPLVAPGDPRTLVLRLDDVEISTR